MRRRLKADRFDVRSLREGDQFSFAPDIRFKCPWCQKPVLIDTNKGGAVHELDCETFMNMDILDFVKRAREKMRN